MHDKESVREPEIATKKMEKKFSNRLNKPDRRISRNKFKQNGKKDSKRNSVMFDSINSSHGKGSKGLDISRRSSLLSVHEKDDIVQI